MTPDEALYRLATTRPHLHIVPPDDGALVRILVPEHEEPDATQD